MEIPQIAFDTSKIPEELKARRQWVCWKYELRDDKLVKVPLAPWATRHEGPASVTDPNNMTTFELAVETAKKHGLGIGFCFFSGDGLAGVDFDSFTEEAQEIIKEAHSYTETSPSGEGAHIIGFGKLQQAIKKENVEVYSRDRYFTVTGAHVEGTSATLGNIQAVLDQLQVKYGDKPTFKPKLTAKGEFKNQYGWSLNDIRQRDRKLDELLSMLEPAGYPSPSEADMAALSKLLFWGFSESEAVEILMRFRNRDKLNRDDYVERTLRKVMPVSKTIADLVDVTKWDLKTGYHISLIDTHSEHIEATNVWFGREDLAVKKYEGEHPPCIRELLKGVDQELRNEAAIRLSSYLVNFRGMEPEKAQWHLKRWNKLNSPSLADAELLEVFKSSLKGHVFGCNDPLLKRYCGSAFASGCRTCPLRRKEEKQPEKERVFDEATLSKARALLAKPEFFYELGKVFEKGFIVPKINKPRFVIGEERNKRLLGPLLIGASKLAMTSIIKVLGEPGTAKDTLLRMWLVLLPIKSVERSYMTAASLRYSPDMQNADLLYIPDTPELQGEMGRQLRFMRSDDGGLISEYAVRDSETGEMTTKVVTLPIKGLATTSNAITGDAALESGMWTLTTNPSPELTKDVKKEKLKLRAGERPLLTDDELNLWQAVFKVLVEEDPQEIPLVPYAKQLFDLLESERSESRRDPDKLCDLISLVAWIRRFQKTPEKRMEADLIDLYFALQLGLDAITQTISELSPKEQQLFEAFTGTVAVTCRDVADKTKIPYKTCYNYLEKLVDKGYLNQDKEKNRNIYSVLSTEKKPKSFLFSVRRDVESPEQLVKVVLGTVRNSSTEQVLEEDTYTFVDPLKGSRITVIRKEKQDEVTIDVKKEDGSIETERCVCLAPTPAQRRSSDPSKEPVSEQEKKPNPLLPDENRTENSLAVKDTGTQAAKPTYTYRHVKPAEPCELCGQQAVEWEITTPRGDRIRRCNQCSVKMRKNTPNVDWQEQEAEQPSPTSMSVM